MQPSNEAPAPLDEDLGRLIAEMDLRPVRIDAVSSARSPRPAPGAFRLRLRDGTELKATLTTSVDHAKKLEHLLGCLDPSIFPPVLGRYGRVVIVEWVEGEPLSTAAAPDQLREAAGLQVALHLTPVPIGCPYRMNDLAAAVAKAEADLAAAAEMRVIGAAEVRAALEIARRAAPTDCGLGLVHRDLCAENLVVRTDGRLCPIDNETVSLGPFEFDLARTWYRWPMDAARRRIYCDAYARQRPLDPFLDAFPFWALAVLADSIQLRRSATPAILAEPVERLRSLLGVLARGGAARELAFQT